MGDTEIQNVTDENQYQDRDGEDRLLFSVDGHMTRYKSSSARNESKPHFFADFALKFIGQLKNECQPQGEGFWVCRCTGRGGVAMETRTIILHASAFMKVNEFCNEVNKRWNGGTFSVGGSVSRGILSEYMLHLKSDYYEQDDQKKFQVANVAGYMGSDYWFLSQGIQVQNGKLIDSENHKFYVVDAESNKANLNLNRGLLETTGLCKEINSKFINLAKNFGSNFAAAMLTVAFVLSRLLRLCSKNTERKNLGETRVGIIYSNAMNVGKSLTQELILYGQGGGSKKHTLFLSGGDLIHSGTSLKMLQKLFGQSNLVYSIDDVKSSDQMSEFLLTYHGGLITGSLSHGLNTPKASGLLLSSNSRETERLKGRVLHFNYSEDASFTDTNDDKVKELKKMCKDYSGFLLAWVIKKVALWDIYEEEGTKLVADILLKNLKGKQRRWCDAMASTIYTNLLYFETNGVHQGIAELVNEQVKVNREASTFMEKLCENIQRKIREQGKPILCWLTRSTTVETDASARGVAAIGIRSVVFEEFTNISAKELNHEIKLLGKGFSKTMWFAKEGMAATEVLIGKRGDENAVSQRGHKIPKNKLPEKTLELINKAIDGEDISFTQAEENNEISEEDAGKLRRFQRRVRQTIEDGMIDDDEREEVDEDVQKAIDSLTPNSKLSYESYTPRKREIFAMGVKAGKRIKFNDLSDDDNDNSSSDERERQRFRRDLFAEGSIGILPRDNSRPRQSTPKKDEEEDAEEEIPASYESAYPKSNVKTLTRRNGYCYCKKYQTGKFVGCDSGRADCPGYNPVTKESWFHVKCVGLKDIPDGEWYCKECSHKACSG